MTHRTETASEIQTWIDETIDGARRDRDDAFALVDAFEMILDRLSNLVSETTPPPSPVTILSLIEHTAEQASVFIDADAVAPGPFDMLDTRFRDLHRTVLGSLGWTSEENAAYLFRFAVTPAGFFVGNVVSAYDTLLGASGASHYIDLVARGIQGITERRPGDHEGFTPAEKTLLDLANGLGTRPSSLDIYLRVRSIDRSTPSKAMAAIDLYIQHGMMDRAVELVEEAMDGFGDLLSMSHLDYFRSLLVEGGRREVAAELAWRLFREGTPLYYLPLLRETVGDAWTDSSWRLRAIDSLRSRAVDDSKVRRGVGRTEISRSDLIDILLVEDAIDEAWQEAIDFDCSRKQWLALARGLSASRPDDAIAIYQAHVEALETRTSARAYDELIDILTMMRTTLESHDRLDEFLTYLRELKEHLARRRKLIAMMEKKFGAAPRVDPPFAV